MPDPEARTPVAPVVESAPPAAEEVTSSPAGDAGAAPTAVESERERELRNRLAQQGRDIQAERSARQAAEQQLATTTQSVQSLTQRLGSIEQAQAQQRAASVDAYIRSLPPQQQIPARLKLQEQEIANLRAIVARQAAGPPPGAQQQAGYTPEQVQAYTQQRSREIIQQVNQQAGLPAAVALSGDEEELDWADEKTFIASAQTLARVRSRQSSAGDPAVAKPKNETPEQTKERIKQEVLAELGVGRPNAAKPSASSKNGAPSVEDFQAVQRTYKPAGGNRAQLDKLRDMRDQARSSVR